jgi:hypothetical protein
MSSVEALLMSHDQLVVLADRVEALLQQDDLLHALETRAKLSADFNSYIAQEIRFVRSAMNGNVSTGVTKQIQGFVEECKTVRRMWDNYMTEWVDEAASLEPACFQLETSSMIQQMRRRLKHAAELLCPLGIRSGAIKLRAA